MPLAVILILFALVAGALAAFVYYGVVHARIWATSRQLPTARDGLLLDPVPEPVPHVAMVVPAHNEQDVIVDLVTSLRAQRWPRLHVTLVLDRCTDDTERLAREAVGGDARFTILINDACPDDWAGKVHAVHRGVVHGGGTPAPDLLLFADADTVFHPDAIDGAVRLLLQRELDMLSLLTTLTRDTWFERIVQPAAGFELVRQFPLDYVNRPDAGRAFANGQFMLFRREAYEAIGGHEAVRGALLEDLAFARRMARPRARRPVGVLLAEGMVCCRMYRSWPAFQRGWARIFTEAAHTRPARLRKAARRVFATGVLMPACALGALVAGVLTWGQTSDTPLGVMLIVAGFGALLQMLLVLRHVYHSQGARLVDVVLYPVGAWLVAALLRRAASDLEAGVATTWGGRVYTREVRE